MKGDSVPPADHISRLCGGSHIDPDTGSVGPGAFMLKPKDVDNALSVNWLEFLSLADRAAQIAEVQHVLAKKMKKIGPTSRLAVLNTGRAIEAISEATAVKLRISVVHDPQSVPGLWDDPSHSGIHGLPLDDDSPAVALAQCVVTLYSAKL